MNISFLDIAIVILFLFFGIKYLKTKQFDDRSNKYTEESKEKAAIFLGVIFIILAIIKAIGLVLKYKGILVSSSEDMLMSSLPLLVLLAIAIVAIIITYCFILKKK